jgi:hypothetical protein
MRPFSDARLREIEALYRRRFPDFVRPATTVTGDRDVALAAAAALVLPRVSVSGEQG